MEAARAQERKDRVVAMAISLGIGALVLLFLILFKIITPNPPFEFAGEEGMEMNFGTYNEGTGNVEENGIGEATSVVSEAQPTPTNVEANKDEVVTVEDGVDINQEKEKPKVQNNTTVIVPIKAPETPVNASNPLLNAFVKNKNKNGSNNGGDGNSGNAGNDGVPDGNPNTDGIGGVGNNPNFNGVGPGGTGISLAGRKIVTPPSKVTDGKEEGLVVVLITVNKEGKVIEADPNGRGTTTSSGVLKSKARQAALSAVFSASDKFDIQKGVMTFKFEF